MSAMKPVITFLFSVAFPTLGNAAVTVTEIRDVVVGSEVKIVVAGSEVKIIGSEFGKKESPGSFVKFTIGDQNIKAEIIAWKDDEITVVVPVFPSVLDKADVSIEISAAGVIVKKESDYTAFNFLILEAIHQKQKGITEEFILNQFDTRTSNRKMTIRDPEIVALKAAGFNDDVIGKLAGHKQHLTIGVAAIMLRDTRDLVTSPILRVFLKPKSFFDYRKPFWGPCWGILCAPSGIVDASKYDLNFGYTSKTAADSGTENKSYVLVGFSFELNRSALLNFGGAFVPGDGEKKHTQMYLGLTVDYNVLKELGIVTK